MRVHTGSYPFISKGVDLHGDGYVNGPDELLGLVLAPIEGLWISHFGILRQLAPHGAGALVKIVLATANMA